MFLHELNTEEKMYVTGFKIMKCNLNNLMEKEENLRDDYLIKEK